MKDSNTILLGLVALATFSTVRGTTNGKGLLYPFTIDSQLTCYREVKLSDGTVNIVPEPIVRLGYGQRMNNSRVLLPEDTSFRQPPIRELTDDIERELLSFLGSDYNPLLTSVSRPNRDPPKACEFLPASEGSAGQLKQHIEVVEEPVPLFIDRQNSDTFMDLLNFDGNDILGLPPIRNDRTTNPELIGSNFASFTGLGFGDDYQNYLNNIDEMCELWIAKCPLTPVWAELPQTFFPRYFAQGTCSGKNCSYPRALFCEEDFTYSVYVTVLRWDCCYNAELGQYRWDCGWRKVQIPILCDCTCACGVRFGTQSG